MNVQFVDAAMNTPLPATDQPNDSAASNADQQPTSSSGPGNGVWDCSDISWRDVSSFVTAHQHIIGYSVPEMVD